MSNSIKGIKKAVGDWNATGRLSARMYYNKETGRVWVNYYTDGNSWTVYYNPQIVEIAQHNNMNFWKMTMSEITRRVLESYGL